MTIGPADQAQRTHLHEVRRARLRQLLERYVSMSEFAIAIGEPLSYVSRLVKLQKTGRKNLGEGKARKIEQELGLPAGSLDNDDGLPLLPTPPQHGSRSRWPFQFSPAIWDQLTPMEKRRTESMLLTIINGIEAERAQQKDAG